MPMLLFLVAGIILRLTSGWFHGQHTVGDVLIVFSAIVIALMIVVGGSIAALFKKL